MNKEQLINIKNNLLQIVNKCDGDCDHCDYGFNSYYYDEIYNNDYNDYCDVKVPCSRCAFGFYEDDDTIKNCHSQNGKAMIKTIRDYCFSQDMNDDECTTCQLKLVDENYNKICLCDDMEYVKSCLKDSSLYNSLINK